jgi:undecaprenyl diphosphate synthase
LNEESFSKYLYTSEVPDPDLLIRTSGEMRVSNFLLYQLAYSELYFTPVLWPDFRREHLYEAIINYQKRERRFGMTGDQLREAGVNRKL